MTKTHQWGSRFRELREHTGLSLREVARVAKVSHALLSFIERGMEPCPRPDIAGRLLGALSAAPRVRGEMRRLATKERCRWCGAKLKGSG